MKRIICILLSVTALLSFAGCDNGGDVTTAAPPVSQAETSADTTGAAPVTNEETKQPGEMTDEEYLAAFTPVLRFIVCSDVHFEDGNTVERERFDKMCSIAYAEAGKDAKYNTVDAFCIAGDFANTGSETQMRAFRQYCNKNAAGSVSFLPILGNHEYFGNSDPVASFKKIFDLEKNYTVEINGYKFILITPDVGGAGYSSETRKWLNEQLAASDPNKPVFVFQHHHITGTVYGGDSGWGVSELDSVLKKYPFVVDFSGHSHFPINDPKSIWQGEYTALGTGTLSYYEMALGTENGIFPTGGNGEYKKTGSHKDAAQFYIVEADKNGALVIKMYDILSDSYMCDPYIIRTPADKASFSYTRDARTAASQQPYFTDGDINIGNIKDNSVTVTFNQAKQEGGNDVVWYYVISVYDGEGNRISSVRRLSDYYYLPVIKQISLNVGGLSAGSEYRVEIVAHNCWEKESKPITATFKTTGTYKPDDGSVPQADVFDAVITTDGITNRVDGVKLEQKGNAALSNGELTLDADGYFKYNDIEKSYTAMSCSVTMESVIKFDTFASPYTNPFANLEAGGIGFESTPDGVMQFYIMVNGTYFYPSYRIETGKYYHFVGTYDGSVIKFYVDGVLRDSITAEGSITWPTNGSAKYLCVGSDSGDGGVSPLEAALHGSIKTARLYSTVLSAAQIKALSEQAK